MKFEQLYRKLSSSEDTSSVNDHKYDAIEEDIRKQELRRLELENAAREGENAGDDQDRQQRKEFADKIFDFVRNYMP